MESRMDVVVDSVLDTVCSSSKSMLLNSKLMSFNIKVNKVVSNTLREEGFRLLGMIGTNLLSCINKKQSLVYSRDNNNPSFKRDDGTKVTTKEVIKCIDWLVLNGYALSITGTAHKDVELRLPSLLIPTEKFISKFSKQESLLEAEQNYLSSTPVMILRSRKDKGSMKELPIRMTAEMKQTERRIREYNNMLNAAIIEDEDGNTLTNVYTRIWSWGSMKLSGRWYGSVVNIPRVDRLGIKINGSKVVEIDYVGIHPRILWAMYGKSLLEFPHDIYTEIANVKSAVDRKISKLALLIYLNAFDTRTAQLAIQGEINELSTKEKDEYTLGKAKDVLSKMIEWFEFHGMDVKQDYQGENNIGLLLQNKDSELAGFVIKHLCMINVPVLVVHDSFIVPEQNQHITEQVMAESFKMMFNDRSKVPLTIEEKRNGIVTKQRKSV
jgi:hypothetical protein